MTTPSIALWRRAREVFEALLAHPPAARADAVSQHCAGDLELEGAVRQLLAFDIETEGPAAVELESLSGRVVGGYALTRVIGRGGLGVVYLATREGVDFEQRVAVKLLQRPVEAESDRRFARERQILARLQHPGIARLIDGGRTAEGLPYLVMEWVDGEPLTAACDLHRLGLEARIGLFLEVAEAVAHAHQLLIVHLDLKPSNILVNTEGRTRLLDFGISQIVDPEEPGTPGTRTARWLSPAYASPEQILGEPVATASDVYSLGLLLFELLTGSNPQPARLGEILGFFAHDAPHASEVARRASTEALEARRTTARALSRELAGDLDALLAKALAREVSERYSSVAALVRDVRRFQAGKSISAYRGWRLRRVQRFARRNAGWVTAGAAGLALVASGVFGAASSSRRSAAERELAEADREKAEMVTAALLDTFNLADPTAGGSVDPTVRRILQQAGERVERLYSYDPALQTALRAGLGNFYRRLNEFERAEALLEKARSARRDLFGETSRQYAHSLAMLSTLRLDQGRLDDADRLARESITIYRALSSPDPLGLAAELAGFGKIQEARGEWAAAEALYHESFSLHRGTRAPTGMQRANYHRNLAGVAVKLGEYERARTEYQAAVRTIRELPGDNRYFLLDVRNNLATMDYQQGHLAESEEGFREVFEICREWFGPEHGDTGAAQANLAALLQARGRYAEAETFYRTALANTEREVDAAHPDVAKDRGNLGNLLREAGRAGEARPMLEATLAAYRERLSEDHPRMRSARNNLALALVDLGELARARELFEAALTPATTPGISPGPPWFAPWINANFAKLELREGRGREAFARASAARAELAGQLPVGHYRLAEVDSVLGAALGEVGERERAIALLEGAYRTLRATKTDASRATREARAWLEELRAR